MWVTIERLGELQEQRIINSIHSKNDSKQNSVHAYDCYAIKIKNILNVR